MAVHTINYLSRDETELWQGQKLLQTQCPPGAASASGPARPRALTACTEFRKYWHKVWAIALFLQPCSKRASNGFASRQVLFYPFFPADAVAPARNPHETREVQGLLLVPPPPRPRSGRSAALRPPDAHGGGVQHTAGSKRVFSFLSCKHSQQAPPTPEQRHRLRRTPHTRGAGARRRPDTPRLSPALGPERPRRARPAAPAATAGQGGLARLVLPGAGPSARPRVTFPPRNADTHPARHRTRLRLPAEGEGEPASFSAASLPASLSGAGEGSGSFLPFSSLLPAGKGALDQSPAPCGLFFPQTAVRAKVSVFPESARSVALPCGRVCGCWRLHQCLTSRLL